MKLSVVIDYLHYKGSLSPAGASTGFSGSADPRADEQPAQ